MHLRRKEEANEVRRFYVMTVQLELWGGVTLGREWSQSGGLRWFIHEPNSEKGRTIDAIMADVKRMARKGYCTGN